MMIMVEEDIDMWENNLLNECLDFHVNRNKLIMLIDASIRMMIALTDKMIDHVNRCGY